MTALERQLANYAEYHRDARNVATHMVGIPVIVLAVVVLLSRPAWDVAGTTITPAMIAAALAAIYYLRLDLRFGVTMAVLLALCCWAGLAAAALPTGWWLAIGIGAFAGGWALQFLGHHYEGRKPAFMDDLRGLVIGPLFVVAETAFLLGLRRDLRAAIAASPPA